MNAALATKAGKALILASTMSLAINAAVSASNASAAVPLGSQATLSLSSLYLNAPSGAVTFNGLPFQVGSAWQLGFGQSATAPASFAKPVSVAVLVNTSNTYYWYLGDTAGQVVLTFSDGSTQTTNLVVGSNVRDWDSGAGFAVNTVTDAASTPAWTGSTTSGDAAVIDMLTIPVATTTANLVSVTVTNANSCCDPYILVDGISVTYDPATPTTTFVWPGNSSTSQAINHSAAPQHSHSCIFNPSLHPTQSQSSCKEQATVAKN